MSSKNYDESGYNLISDLLTIFCSLRVSYPRRSGLVGKGNHSTPIYLSRFRILHFQSLGVPISSMCRNRVGEAWSVDSRMSLMNGENRQPVTDEPVEFEK